MSSLQDQLLKAGMVDEKKAKKIKKDKRKQARQTPKGQTVVNEARELAKQAQAEKSARDREINRQQQAVAERKAIAAQIRQLSPSTVSTGVRATLPINSPTAPVSKNSMSAHCCKLS